MPAIIVTLILISILILVHELGHFLAAKMNGIGVEEFGFGYPPMIWKKKIKGTIYSINALPFGGFVRLLGEEEQEKIKVGLSEKAYFSKPKWRKAIVILAGVIGNFLLGVFCFSIIYTHIGIPQKVGYVIIKDIAENSPAEEAGLKIGDKITQINALPVGDLNGFISYVNEQKGNPIKVRYITTDKKSAETILIPRLNPPEGEGAIGVAVSDIDQVFYAPWQMPFRGAWFGLKEALLWGATIILGLVTAVKQLFSGVIPEVAGPVGIFQLTNDVMQEGRIMLLKFMGVLSVNLAILNVLPFPALDGGHLVFTIFDRFIKKEKRPQIEHTINAIGMTFLVVLMIAVTVNDVIRLVNTSPFWENIISKIKPF